MEIHIYLKMLFWAQNFGNKSYFGVNYWELHSLIFRLKNDNLCSERQKINSRYKIYIQIHLQDSHENKCVISNLAGLFA